ncbi:MAG: hypothetical protein RL238_2061 [Actinomycetota bacterium]|jgi:hypothetical protein
MVRFLVSTVIAILASAIGLIVAAAILDDMSINGTAFITAVIIFTVVTALAGPFIAKVAMKNDSALLGAVALVSTLVGLIVTHLVTDGLSITGLTTWILAAVIVWLAGLLAALIIPLILVKMGVQAARANRQ